MSVDKIGVHFEQAIYFLKVTLSWGIRKTHAYFYKLD